MVTVPPRPVVMTDVAVLVELVPLDKNVAEEHVYAVQVAQAETVVMMDVVELPAGLALQPKPASMECALVLPLPNVLVECVDLIEPEEAVVLAPLVKDVGQDNVNVTMTVTKEIVEAQFKLREPTLVFAQQHLVEPVLLVSLVELTEDALLLLLAPFPSLWLIAPPEEVLMLEVQFSSLPRLSVIHPPSLLDQEPPLHGIHQGLELSLSKQLPLDTWLTLKVYQLPRQPLQFNFV
jgi:hypothetical protein